MNTTLSVEDKLRALYELQKIDSKIDEIRVLRGELPIEVQDLSDEIEGLELRVSKLSGEIKEFQDFIAQKKLDIKESEDLISKYTKQMDNVKNNREYDALTKELEMQKLEIELSHKRIKDTTQKIEDREKYVKETEDRLNIRRKDLETKKKELEIITAETKKEEAELIDQSKDSKKSIEDRLSKAYNRIRKTYKNGLAVVTFERDSCGGCFGKIPPQRQLEIKQRLKIILCEHCGRILVDPTIEEENTLV